MFQPTTQQKVEYYECEPAPCSVVTKEEVDMREVLGDFLRAWTRPHRQASSPPVVELGSIMLLDDGKRKHLILPFPLEFDRSSVRPYFGATSETFLITEAIEDVVPADRLVAVSDILEEAVGEKAPILLRISEIVDKLIEHDKVFREIDKTKMMESLSALIEKSPQKLMSITDDELTGRIEKVMLIEAMSGMLNELSPAQMKSFESAAKRREFF